MPRTWEAAEPEGGNDFLKLKDGDSALLVIMDAPMMMSKHRIAAEGKPYGERVFCGTPEGMGCPICANQTQYDADTQRTATEGFFSVWVENVTRKGDRTPESVQAMMIDVGGWAKVGAYLAAKKSAELDGLDFVGVPLRVTRTGADQNTKYDVQLRPTAQADPQGDPIDAEEIALKMLAKDHERLGYVSEADPFAANEPRDEDDEAMQVELYTMLGEEAGLASETTRKAFLKAKGIVVRTPADRAKAIEAFQSRLETQKRAAA